MLGNQGGLLLVHVACSMWWSQSSHIEFHWTAGRVLWSHKWVPKRNGETWLTCHCQWKSCPLADHGDLSTGVSVGRGLMASLAWQPHFSVALLLATSTLGQLLIALMVYLDCCVYGSKASLVTEGARRVWGSCSQGLSVGCGGPWLYSPGGCCTLRDCCMALIKIIKWRFILQEFTSMSLPYSFLLIFLVG